MPQPTDIKIRTQSRLLEIRFDDGAHFELPFEYLRVFSPSAEVKGHGLGEGILQLGKHTVGISSVEPIGNYALRLLFDDGHNTGLYSWTLLYDLGTNREGYWKRYLERCEEARAADEAAAGAGAAGPRDDPRPK
ncbi:MAG TPA: DUF971 domain-containing protein [Steroidobacteraceae bacterium]|nr:DUF971 domain-containing protein [Steroidobacteraceae bacterium]